MGALIRRGLSRVVFHLVRWLMIPIEAVHPRLYMRVMIRLLRGMGLRMEGEPRYIARSAYFDDFRRITTGDRLIVSRNVIFLTHDYSLTTALTAIGETPATDIAINLEIMIGNNVFIGMNAILLPGTLIGDDVIVAAGSVVRGVVPGDSVIAGNPAQRIAGITDRADQWRARRTSEAAAADSQ